VLQFFENKAVGNKSIEEVSLVPVPTKKKKNRKKR
jgi:hypothetical protein